MDDRTREALEGSIRKWEAIVAGTGEDLGAINCPLCAEFYDREDTDSDEKTHCRGCPVHERTGQEHCDGPPYDWYDGSREAAREELEFLKSLRPAPLDEMNRGTGAGKGDK
jgi:hypothetical protein